MGIVDEDVARVREASDLVAIASQHLQLKRVGSRWQGLCPFHAEKSPSFSVNGELGLYKCFGCGAGGDVITFVREMEHLDFPGAVEWLAGKAGIQLRYTDRNENEGRKKRKRLLEAMAQAVDWYHERLLSGKDAGEARGYLRSRGFDRPKVEAYRLGWAPDDWDALARSLKLSNDVLRDTGLGFINKRQRQQDLFRGRVLFPIFDAQGDPVAFGGRILPGHDGPKYINSAESPIYAKSKTLYGLNWHKAPIVEADEVIVCEGYTDVIGFADVGIPRAVATCGTALTEEHVRTMKRYARRVVLAFDPDEAGQSAAERFYAWESKYEVDVAVADLPKGVDPADLARDDPDALRAAVEEATPFLGFRVQRALRAGSLASPEARARTAQAALTVIREHPSELVRDQYVMQVADHTRLDPDQLRTQLRRPAGDEVQVSAAAAKAPTAEDGPEFEALRVAIHRPDDVADLLYEHLFTDERAASAFRALADGGDPHDILERADPWTRDLLQRLWVEDTQAEGDEVVTRLVREALRRQIRVLENESRTGGDALAISMEVNRLGKLLHLLDDERTSIRSSDELLAWLSEGVEQAS